LASVVASVPQQTVAAVETTWVGTAELLQEAVDEGHQQVGQHCSCLHPFWSTKPRKHRS
jgi:hypothetical protein